MNLATAATAARNRLHLLRLAGGLASSSLSFVPLRCRAASSAAPRLIPCSISQIHSYGTGTVDSDKLKWRSLYRRIATIADPAAGPRPVLDRWEVEEPKLSKSELCRVVKELRKFGRFKLALEVYGWMSAHGDRFTFTSNDMAIKLDLIAKVHDIVQAEKHFLMLDDTLKDKRTYGALLNAYGHAKMKEKAEATLETMRNNGYATKLQLAKSVEDSDAIKFNNTLSKHTDTKEYL